MSNKPNCLDGYISTNKWDLASKEFASGICRIAPEARSQLIPDEDMKERVLKSEAELKGKHSYYFKRFCDATIYCDICGQTKIKINVFVNNNEVGDDSHYLACVRCKRP